MIKIMLYELKVGWPSYPLSCNSIESLVAFTSLLCFARPPWVKFMYCFLQWKSTLNGLYHKTLVCMVLHIILVLQQGWKLSNLHLVRKLIWISLWVPFIIEKKMSMNRRNMNCLEAKTDGCLKVSCWGPGGWGWPLLGMSQKRWAATSNSHLSCVNVFCPYGDEAPESNDRTSTYALYTCHREHP